jgi:hypothetical protein
MHVAPWQGIAAIVLVLWGLTAIFWKVTTKFQRVFREN